MWTHSLTWKCHSLIPAQEKGKKYLPKRQECSEPRYDNKSRYGEYPNPHNKYVGCEILTQCNTLLLCQSQHIDSDNVIINITKVSLLIVARNARGTHLHPYCSQEDPPRHFPHRNQCCGWTGPCGSSLWFIMIALLLLQGVLQQKTIRELWGTRSITHRSRRVHGTHEGYTVSCCVCGEGMGEQASMDLGSAFLRV